MRTAYRTIVTVLRASAAAVAFVPGASFAGEAVAPIEIKVNFVSERSQEINLCRASESTQPPAATVSCTPTPAAPTPISVPPGRKLHFSNVRFYISGSGDWLGTVDETMGLGTVTSWRVIRLANRDYLEMMVGW
jgi:hypothetical protein